MANRSATRNYLSCPATFSFRPAPQSQITAENADRIQCRLLAEGANGPTTLEADEVLNQRGIFILPDILANAGGVTVSYFEWVQDTQNYMWTLDEVNARLKGILTDAFCRTLNRSQHSLALICGRRPPSRASSARPKPSSPEDYSLDRRYCLDSWIVVAIDAPGSREMVKNDMLVDVVVIF